MKILINDKEAIFNKDDFPILISGACKTGSSIFSISLVTSLVENGNKVLFLTAYPEAKEDFRRLLGESIDEKAIIVDSGEEDFFIEKLNHIDDLENTVVLLKNMDVYSTKIYDVLKDHKLVIFSGDMDKCEFREQLANKKFKTKIFFSYPEKIEIDNKIELPKYKGLIRSQKYNGVISL